MEVQEKIVKRSQITNPDFKRMFKTERHHKHPIIIGADGRPRWKENPDVRYLIDEKISLNDLCPLLCILGYDKNSEVYRELYRQMGYSLFGYWEIFYWEVNNPNAADYQPPSTS